MENNKPAGLITRVRAWVAGIGILTVLGLFSAGIIFWGGFNTAMEYTNTEKFCISCHEMKDNVYAEYQNTIHYSNRSGVRAICSDCHVPQEWVPKMIRKIQASKEVLGKITGIVDTPEKFEAHRLTMASREWARMKANNSQECRNCHNFEYFDYGAQGRRGANTHQQAFNEGQTCIDCHKGIAHKLPEVDQSITVINADGAPQQVFHPPVKK
jgi:cytochrome c-type protein NapC